MVNPRMKRYLYIMLAGFGAIGLSLLLFMLLDRADTVGTALKKVSDILAPFVYGGVVAYLLRPLCNHYEQFFQNHLPRKLKRSYSKVNAYRSLLRKTNPQNIQILFILNHYK